MKGSSALLQRLAFTHASNYVIAIDGEQEKSSGAAEAPQPEGTDGTAGNGAETEESPEAEENSEAIQVKKTVLWPIAAGITVFAAIAFVLVLIWKKREEEEETK